MALRWVRTIDEAPHMFASGDEENADWLLYCGAWQVGRVHRPGGAQQQVLSSSLTGPHSPEAPVDKHGDAATIEEAKGRLITALRAWAAWAGVRREGADAPRWIRNRDLQPMRFGAAYEDETDWVLVSGGFVVGRVHRPLAGPRHDPHWMLTGARTPQAPLEQQDGRPASTTGRRSSSARGARGCDGPNCRCPTRLKAHSDDAVARSCPAAS